MADHQPGSDQSNNAVLDAPPEQAAKPASPKVDKLPPFRVLLHNDDHNDPVFVAETIEKLTPLGRFESFRTMLTAHNRGLALVLMTHKERAELYQDQFVGMGLTVTIEPAG